MSLSHRRVICEFVSSKSYGEFLSLKSYGKFV